MDMELLDAGMFGFLRECDLVYRTRYSQEELELLAGIFVDDLGKTLSECATKSGLENPEGMLLDILAECFRRHRVESRIFPAPSHVKMQIDDVAIDWFRPKFKAQVEEGEPARPGTGRMYLEMWRARRKGENDDAIRMREDAIAKKRIKKAAQSAAKTCKEVLKSIEKESGVKVCESVEKMGTLQ